MTTPYQPSIEALKFIAFVRASGNEENISPEVHYRIADALFSGSEIDKKVLIECTRGLGKALALGSKVYTPTGVTTIGDVQVGDKVLDRDAKVTTVLAKSEVFFKPTYRMTLADGRQLTTCEDHSNIVWARATTDFRPRKGSAAVFRPGGLIEKVYTTKELYEKGLYYSREITSKHPTGREYKFSIPVVTTAVDFPVVDTPIDPYTVGVILGDGNIAKDTGFTRITSHINDYQELCSFLPYGKGFTKVKTPSIKFFSLKGIGPRVKAFIGVKNVYAKRVPGVLLHASKHQRLEVLKGLMDTDGSAHDTGVEFSSVSKGLAEDVVHLVRSLGGIARMREHATASPFGKCYRVAIRIPTIIFKLSRKVQRQQLLINTYATAQMSVAIVGLELIPTEATQCISVSSESHSFITDGFTVTHNSTLVEYAVIYAAAMGEWPGFGKVPFIVFLGASQEGNVKQFFKNVANKVERSKFISSVLKVTRQTDNEIELENADGVELAVIGKGMSTNFRGLRNKTGHRPTMVIADDILSNEVMTSDAVRNTIDTNWYNSVLPALDPTRHKVVFIGTPISEKDLLAQIKSSGTYRVERYPLCSSFPCLVEDFDSVWPDRFTYKYAMEMYKQFESAGKTQGFSQEYLLNIVDLTSLLVDEDDIKWFDPMLVKKNKDGYNLYITTDFATSTKKSADYSVISVWAINNNNDWMLVDGQCVRQSMQENIIDTFEYVRKWRPLSVGIETSGQQGGFLSIIDEEMQRKNVYFNLAKKKGSKEPGIRPSKDKVHRFVTGVQPKFKQGKIWFPKPELCAKVNPRLLGLVKEMTLELSSFTLAGGVKTLAHDDAIDTLNQLSEMDVYAPSENAGEDKYFETHNKSEIWADWEDESAYSSNGSTVF